MIGMRGKSSGARLYYYFQQLNAMRKFSHSMRDPFPASGRRQIKQPLVPTVEIFINNLDHHIAQSYAKLRRTKQKAAQSVRASPNHRSTYSNVNTLKKSLAPGNAREQKGIKIQSIAGESESEQRGAEQQDAVLLSNEEVKEYINLVYQKYNIRNPMEQPQRLDQHQSLGRHKKLVIIGGGNRHNFTDMGSDRRKRRKSSAAAIKDKIVIQKNIDLAHFAGGDTATKDINLSASLYSTLGQKSSFLQTGKQGYAETVTSCSARKEEFSNSKYITEGDTGAQIPAVFRFCFACEQAVLEHNIRYHEKSCRLLQRAMQKSQGELVAILDQKIGRLCLQIEGSFIESSQQQWLSEFKDLRRSVGDWIGQVRGSKESSAPSGRAMRVRFSKVQDQFSRGVGGGCELLSKLSWFSRLRQNLRRRLYGN